MYTLQRSLKRRKRRAFTLVELLVVLGIILLMAALGVAFVPRASERQKTSRGADQLQGWLLIAKQWAKKDRIPTGIRLLPGQTYPSKAAANSAFITDLQYIQQPADFYQQGTSIAAETRVIGGNSFPVVRGYYTANNTGFDFFGGLGAGGSSLWPVQVGDYLEIKNGGPVFRIIGVIADPLANPQTPNLGNILVISRAADSAVGGLGLSTMEYRIFRAPRPLQGESPLQLPSEVAIDATTNLAFGNPLPTNPSSGHTDILFAPNGSVIGAGTTTDKIVLWIRDVTLDANLPGDQTLVTVYTRTGFIAAHPVFQGANTTCPNATNPGVTISVASAADINIGSYLVIGYGTASKETRRVANVQGNNITFFQPLFLPHQAGSGVVGDPYSFTRDGRSSGL